MHFRNLLLLLILAFSSKVPLFCAKLPPITSALGINCMVNERRSNREEMALKAVMDNDLDGLTTYLTIGVDPNTQFDTRTAPMLHMAAVLGHVKIAEYLLAMGANINARHKDGFTPIMYALCNESHDTCSTMTKILLAHHAAVNESVELKKPMEDNTELKYRLSVLSFAIMHMQTTAISDLLRAQANPNPTHAHEAAPIYLAAINGDVDTIKLLLAYGASVSQPFGLNPLLAASKNGHIGAVWELLQAGINPSMRDIYGQTALQAAAAYNHQRIAQLLLDAGANDAIKDNDNLSPIDFAEKNSATYNVLKSHKSWRSWLSSCFCRRKNIYK